MALILQLETSTISCSVALAADGETIAVKEIAERNAHASHLTIFIDQLMRECGKTMHNLDAVAVSMGPGSYTGLRIGVSTAKGLCYASDIPLISIGTLKAMAFGCRSELEDERVLYCPMIDARRMEVYTGVYDAKLNTVQPVEARIVDEQSFSDLLESQKVVFFGDGAMKCREVVSHEENALFIPDFFNSAKNLSTLAFEKYQANDFEDVAYFEPYYLKDFVVTQPRKG